MLSLSSILDALSCLSIRTLSLAVRNPRGLPDYISGCLRRYEEMAGDGLPCRSPVIPAENLTVTIPASHKGGGMSFGELVIIARVTKVLNPRIIFEIGTYHGLTTSVFILNSDSDAQVLTLDLPVKADINWEGIATDKELVASRELGAVPRALGLNRYIQLHCDSMSFDPSPYLDSVDLGLIDGAHDLAHVKNDTVKMASMMSDRGIIFWHDYGGKGAFRSLSSYLEDLGKQCPLFRIQDTALAWAPAQELKRIVLTP